MSEISQEVATLSEGNKFISDIKKKLAFNKSRDVKIRNTEANNAVFKILEDNLPGFVVNLHNPVTLQHKKIPIISTTGENKAVNAVIQEVVSKPLLLNQSTTNSTVMKLLIRMRIAGGNDYNAPLIPNIKISKNNYKKAITDSIAREISDAIQDAYVSLCNLKTKTIISHELLTYHMLLNLIENIESLAIDCFNKVTAYDRLKDIINNIRSHREPTLIAKRGLYAKLLARFMQFINDRQKILSNLGSENFLYNAVSVRFRHSIHVQLGVIDNILRYVLFDIGQEISEATFSEGRYKTVIDVSKVKNNHSKRLFRSLEETDNKAKPVQNKNLTFLQAITNNNNSAKYYLDKCANTTKPELREQYYQKINQITTEAYYLRLLDKVGIFSKSEFEKLEVKTTIGIINLANNLKTYLAKFLSLRAKLHIVRENMQAINGLIKYWGNQSKQQLKTEYANVFNKYKDISIEIANVADSLSKFINTHDGTLRKLVNKKVLSEFYITEIYRVPLKKLDDTKHTVINDVDTAIRSMQQQAIDRDIEASKKYLLKFGTCHQALVGGTVKLEMRNKSEDGDLFSRRNLIINKQLEYKQIVKLKNNESLKLQNKASICYAQSSVSRVDIKGGVMEGAREQKSLHDDMRYYIARYSATTVFQHVRYFIYRIFSQYFRKMFAFVKDIKATWNEHRYTYKKLDAEKPALTEKEISEIKNVNFALTSKVSLLQHKLWWYNRAKKEFCVNSLEKLGQYQQKIQELQKFNPVSNEQKKLEGSNRQEDIYNQENKIDKKHVLRESVNSKEQKRNVATPFLNAGNKQKYVSEGNLSEFENPFELQGEDFSNHVKSIKNIDFNKYTKFIEDILEHSFRHNEDNENKFIKILEQIANRNEYNKYDNEGGILGNVKDALGLNMSLKEIIHDIIKENICVDAITA